MGSPYKTNVGSFAIAILADCGVYVKIGEFTMSNWKPIEIGIGRWQFETIKPSEVVTLAECQPRVDGTDDTLVAEYAADMQAYDAQYAEYDPKIYGWQKFPRLECVYVSDVGYILFSGFHRLAAIRSNDYTEIEIAFVGGTRQDAILFSKKANADNGKRRTNADKAHVVKSCLLDDELKLWSDRQIADWCGVDHKTVAKYEKELGKFPSENRELYTRPTRRKRLSKSGNIEWVETASIGNVSEKPSRKDMSPEPDLTEAMKVSQKTMWQALWAKQEEVVPQNKGVHAQNFITAACNAHRHWGVSNFPRNELATDEPEVWTERYKLITAEIKQGLHGWLTAFLKSEYSDLGAEILEYSDYEGKHVTPDEAFRNKPADDAKLGTVVLQEKEDAMWESLQQLDPTWNQVDFMQAACDAHSEWNVTEFPEATDVTEPQVWSARYETLRREIEERADWMQPLLKILNEPDEVEAVQPKGDLIPVASDLNPWEKAHQHAESVLVAFRNILKGLGVEDVDACLDGILLFYDGLAYADVKVATEAKLKQIASFYLPLLTQTVADWPEYIRENHHIPEVKPGVDFDNFCDTIESLDQAWAAADLPISFEDEFLLAAADRVNFLPDVIKELYKAGKARQPHEEYEDYCSWNKTFKIILKGLQERSHWVEEAIAEADKAGKKSEDVDSEIKAEFYNAFKALQLNNAEQLERYKLLPVGRTPLVYAEAIKTYYEFQSPRIRPDTEPTVEHYKGATVLMQERPVEFIEQFEGRHYRRIIAEWDDCVMPELVKRYADYYGASEIISENLQAKIRQAIRDAYDFKGRITTQPFDVLFEITEDAHTVLVYLDPDDWSRDGNTILWAHALHSEFMKGAVDTEEPQATQDEHVARLKVLPDEIRGYVPVWIANAEQLKPLRGNERKVTLKLLLNAHWHFKHGLSRGNSPFFKEEMESLFEIMKSGDTAFVEKMLKVMKAVSPELFVAETDETKDEAGFKYKLDNFAVNFTDGDGNFQDTISVQVLPSIQMRDIPMKEVPDALKTELLKFVSNIMEKR